MFSLADYRLDNRLYDCLRLCDRLSLADYVSMNMLDVLVGRLCMNRLHVIVDSL